VISKRILVNSDYEITLEFSKAFNSKEEKILEGLVELIFDEAGI
jgi:hypothetical protein